MDPRYLENVREGMKVEILTSHGKVSRGFVQELAVRKPFNEDGIMVRLSNGDFGRVKKIILSEPEINERNAEEIKKIIKRGESFHVEFKSSVFWSRLFNPVQIKESKSSEIKEFGQRASKVIIARSIAAFLNSDGGSLIIGVKENKETDKDEIVGIESDIEKINDKTLDGYKRAIIDEIIKAFFPAKIFHHLNNYISIDFVRVDRKTVCWIKIRPSDSKVFLVLNSKEIFMIRVDSENRTLDGEKLVDYCLRKWGK